jgi:hypothetical protein
MDSIMLENYLTPYLVKKIADKELAQAIKYELNRRIYHYGDHLKGVYSLKKTHIPLRESVRRIILFSRLFFAKRQSSAPFLYSNAYVSASTHPLQSSQFEFRRPPWDLSLRQKSTCHPRDFLFFQKVKGLVTTASINELLSDDFQKLVSECKNRLRSIYADPNCQGGIFSNDLCFFEVLSISVLRELGKPSFVFIHGLPGIYIPELNNLSTYTLVWGRKIKELMIENGSAPNKVLIAGHPFVRPHSRPLKNSLERVLVISKAPGGAQFYDKQAVLADRGNCIHYCYLVQDSLKKAGVKNAILRIHPSEEPEFYKQSIDLDFYQLDTSPRLQDAFAKTTFVIGPTSSVFLEALHFGINYLAFDLNLGPCNYPLYPPFDGSDARIATAKSPDELVNVLLSVKSTDPSVLAEYVNETNEFDRVLADVLGKK